ncbi:5-deoxy-glucuronate isomerase [Kaistia sp. MMO-174]|uniref:5-deoxy-glucuronate isomerase n=1 Tax=Kaistia sp. MMO-174 TaxID=3081256 RepID=UPI00301A90F0
MADLLVKPAGTRGQTIHVTPQSAGWSHIGFDLYQLAPGEMAQANTNDREVCLVLVSGKARIIVEEIDFNILGERMSPFDGKPHAVYVPAEHDWTVTATTEVTLAVCSAPSTGGNLPPRHIRPEKMEHETRGRGTNVRHVTNILPETAKADSLLVVEVITPGGHTSSYPPHKHDTDNLPAESLLEETYYHRLNPPQGFAFQRVYTDDRSLDETMLIEDGVVTLVPRGYHPCATIHGYDLYYLNVMAGPTRTWKFHNAPEHEWLLKD